MTILAAIMTALAAAEFVCLVALTWRRSETKLALATDFTA